MARQAKKTPAQIACFIVRLLRLSMVVNTAAVVKCMILPGSVWFDVDRKVLHSSV